MMSARQASLIVGASQFFVICGALAYTSYPLDPDEAYTLGLVIAALVAWA